jgi:homoserine kinase
MNTAVIPVAAEVRAFAPATVANVCAGFDILGFAVEEPGDVVVARPCEAPGVAIAAITGDQGRLPQEVSANTAGVAALALLARLQPACGVDLEVHKRMPLGSGLGSSAASAVAAVVAVNALFGDPLPRRELLPFALAGEYVSCGVAHADNVAPSLLGGFTLIRESDPLDFVRLPSPASLCCALVHPHVEVRTADARAMLPTEIPLRAAITQWGNAAGLVAGLLLNDYALIGRSLRDVVVEPVRSRLIPGFEDVKRAALETGALGCGISGACPTLFALCDSRAMAESAAEAMCAAFARHGLASDRYISAVNEEGARVLSGAQR